MRAGDRERSRSGRGRGLVDSVADQRNGIGVDGCGRKRACTDLNNAGIGDGRNCERGRTSRASELFNTIRDTGESVRGSCRNEGRACADAARNGDSVEGDRAAIPYRRDSGRGSANDCGARELGDPVEDDSVGIGDEDRTGVGAGKAGNQA